VGHGNKLVRSIQAPTLHTNSQSLVFAISDTIVSFDVPENIETSEKPSSLEYVNCVS